MFDRELNLIQIRREHLVSVAIGIPFECNGHVQARHGRHVHRRGEDLLQLRGGNAFQRAAGEGGGRFRPREVIEHFPGAAERLRLGAGLGVEVELGLEGACRLGIQLAVQVRDEILAVFITEWR